MITYVKNESHVTGFKTSKCNIEVDAEKIRLKGSDALMSGFQFAVSTDKGVLPL